MSLPAKYPPQVTPASWNAMVDAANGMDLSGYVMQYPFSYIVRSVGGVYDAVDDNGVQAFGGGGDAGGVDGGDAGAVIQACITALYAIGGVIKITAGTFPYTNTLKPTDSGSQLIFLEGLGEYTTVLSYTGVEGTNAIENILIKNFTLQGNSTNDVKGFVWNMWSAIAEPVLQSVYINGFKGVGGIGVLIYDKNSIKLFCPKIVNCETGIRLTEPGANDLSIFAPVIVGCTNGIYHTGGVSLHVYGGAIETCDRGYYVTASIDSVLFDGTYWEANIYAINITGYIAGDPHYAANLTFLQNRIVDGDHNLYVKYGLHVILDNCYMDAGDIDSVVLESEARDVELRNPEMSGTVTVNSGGQLRYTGYAYEGTTIMGSFSSLNNDDPVVHNLGITPTTILLTPNASTTTKICSYHDSGANQFLISFHDENGAALNNVSGSYLVNYKP
jgi:hypothetical protein